MMVRAVSTVIAVLYLILPLSLLYWLLLAGGFDWTLSIPILGIFLGGWLIFMGFMGILVAIAGLVATLTNT